MNPTRASAIVAIAATTVLGAAGPATAAPRPDDARADRAGASNTFTGATSGNLTSRRPFSGLRPRSGPAALPTNCSLGGLGPDRDVLTGNARFIASVTCDSAIRQIVLRAELYRNGVLVANSGNRTSASPNFYVGANAPCVSGSYFGRAYGTVYFLSGTPTVISASGQTATVNITC